MSNFADQHRWSTSHNKFKLPPPPTKRQLSLTVSRKENARRSSLIQSSSQSSLSLYGYIDSVRVPVPLYTSTANSLPQVDKIDNLICSLTESEQKDFECPVCWDTEDTIAVTLHCTHMFHKYWLRRCLQVRDSCPCCRRSVIGGWLIFFIFLFFIYCTKI